MDWQDAQICDKANTHRKMLIVESRCGYMGVCCTLYFLYILENFYNEILEKHMQHKKDYYIIYKNNQCDKT